MRSVDERERPSVISCPGSRRNGAPVEPWWTSRQRSVSCAGPLLVDDSDDPATPSSRDGGRGSVLCCSEWAASGEPNSVATSPAKEAVPEPMTDRVFPPLAAVSIAESGARDSSGAESGMQLASPACAGAFSREAAFLRREEGGG